MKKPDFDDTKHFQSIERLSELLKKIIEICEGKCKP